MARSRASVPRATACARTRTGAGPGGVASAAPVRSLPLPRAIAGVRAGGAAAGCGGTGLAARGLTARISITRASRVLDIRPPRRYGSGERSHNKLPQSLQVERLRQVGERTGASDAPADFLSTPGADHDDERRVLAGVELGNELESAAVGKAHVGDNEVGRLRGLLAERRPGAVHHAGLDSFLPQGLCKRLGG